MSKEKENKWEYEELTFQEIDLEPLKKGEPARSFRYASEDKKSGFVVSIFKSKKNKKYYVKVELARKLSDDKSQEGDNDVPF